MGYPGHAAYRDFHTYDHVTGLKPARVTGRNVPSDAKAPYDPERADRFVEEFQGMDRAGTVPNFMMMSLGENHTSGTTPGAYSIGP